jgi:hypothetical protein
MTTKNKAFQRLVVAGYLGLTLLFILIYFLAGYMPESTATLGKLLQDVALNLTLAFWRLNRLKHTVQAGQL